MKEMLDVGYDLYRWFNRSEEHVETMIEYFVRKQYVTEIYPKSQGYYRSRRELKLQGKTLKMTRRMKRTR